MEEHLLWAKKLHEQATEERYDQNQKRRKQKITQNKNRNILKLMSLDLH